MQPNGHLLPRARRPSQTPYGFRSHLEYRRAYVAFAGSNPKRHKALALPTTAARAAFLSSCSSGVSSVPNSWSMKMK